LYTPPPVTLQLSPAPLGQLAVFPLTVLFVTFNVVVDWGLGLLLLMPPPLAPQLVPVLSLLQVAVFPLTVLFVTVVLPPLKRPPPAVKQMVFRLPLLLQLPVFPLTVVFVTVVVPPTGL
jgi:hypothetical protein